MLDDKKKSNNSTGYHSGQAGGIKDILTGATFEGTSVVETLEARVCEVKSYATVRSWTFSWSHRSSGVESQTLDFRRVNTTTVVATRSWGGPRVNYSTINANIHCVMRANILDFIPTNSDFSQRVSDANTLIKNLDTGSMQNQINTFGCTNPQTKAYHNATEAAIENLLNHHCGNNQVGNGRSEDTASRAEEFNVTHNPILSQKVEASYV